ncbi:MAG TPA: penicillin acylase family protein [Thermoanaerobaculia bacterium]|jgi:penicillin amidase|nr:penicillin acylase family protein [Thermoanaerobaculia bacterium]
MKRLRKAIKILLLALAALLIVVLVWGYWKVRRSYPQAEGSIAIAGLSAPVEVVRDRWGVPHLFAQNERDLFMAQGYVHAQDRLWQMQFNRTVASGKISSLIGEAPLPADRYLRTLGLRRAAEKDFARLTPETRGFLEAYTAGVNAFLKTHENSLPIEFSILRVDPDPWTPIDSLAWSRALSLNLSLNMPLELARLRLATKFKPEQIRQLIPPYPAEGPFIVPSPSNPVPALQLPGNVASRQSDEFLRRLAPYIPALGRPELVWGSNSWVVHGSRTATGKPLLANDTHLGLGMPSVWYEVGLHAGRFDVTGYSVSGLPFVIMGQNRRAAWGVTNLNADVQDVYLEKVDDPANPQKVLFQGRWEDIRVERQAIPVKDKVAVTLEVRFTRHGPLISSVMPDWKDPRPLALHWATAEEGSRLLDAISAVDRAGNWQEFHQALSMWDTPSLNFTYADVDGNIGYQSTARVPLRASGHAGTEPVPGWTGQFEWQGYIPYEDMPSQLNPPAGYVVSANHKVVPDSYPFTLTKDWPPPERARRIGELLAANPKATLDDMKKFQADVVLSVAGRMRPSLLAAMQGAKLSDAENKALAAIRDWDLRFDKDSIAPTIYSAWLRFLLPDTFKDEMGDDLMKGPSKGLVFMQSDMVAGMLERPNDPWFDDKGTPGKVETRDDIVRRSFSEAVKWLSDEQGGDPADWKWGGMHRISFKHQPLGLSPVAPLNWIFNSPSLPLSGDGSTINANGGDPEQNFEVGFGPSQRFIADLSDLSRSIAVNSTGQAAFPFHPHRDDQARMWAANEYHPVLASREAAKAQAESVLTLTPEK